MSEAPTFNPGEHLTKVKGNAYLEVKWRVMWFRLANPHGTIDTTLVSHDDKRATFKAIVADESGGFATGYATRTPADHVDYLESAETAAIGRALALLGYGTQFSEISDNGHIADSPVRTASPNMTSDLPGEPYPANDVPFDIPVPLPAENGLKGLKLRWQKQWKIPDKGAAQRWAAFKVNVFGTPVPDTELTPVQMATLNGTVIAEERRVKP